MGSTSDQRPATVGGPVRLGIAGRAKRPAQGRFAAAGAQADPIVVAVDFVEPGRARGDFDERLSVLMKENALACDDDGSPLLVPTGILLTGRPRAAEGEIIRPVNDSLFLEPRLLFRRKPAGLLLATAREQREEKQNDQAARRELIFHRPNLFRLLRLRGQDAMQRHNG